MIGVVAPRADHGVVREFFELFKTPWEFWREDRDYDVVLCAGEPDRAHAGARVLIVYGAARTTLEPEVGIEVEAEACGAMLTHAGRRVPVYGPCLTFRGADIGLVSLSGRRSVAVARRRDHRLVIRVGYDLFGEVRRLLTTGQPPANAGLPALDHHIAVLRDLITTATGRLVEIPPVPDGAAFIACLTHDLDNPSIRRHGCDRTVLGFLGRAVLGSIAGILRGRASVGQLAQNWSAALRLPLIHLGLARDFWSGFDRYLDIERGLPSTFFVIPFKDRPGRTAGGHAPRRRACRSSAADLADQIQHLTVAGCEVGLHGIDAWIDRPAACDELREIRRLTGADRVGARMHWLYGDAGSAAVLDSAGCAYDSTSGYNETVGFRAGTTQVFRPLNARQLLELPLHVMDTALFFPRHLDLAPGAALARVRAIVDHARDSGGVVTINWHDRSVAPERLWDGVYRALVDELRGERPWFASGGAAVAWFRKRRSAVFASESVTVDPDDTVPGVRLRIHRADHGQDRGFARVSVSRVDVAVAESREATVAAGSHG